MKIRLAYDKKLGIVVQKLVQVTPKQWDWCDVGWILYRNLQEPDANLDQYLGWK